MTQRPRIYYSAEQCSVMWGQYKKGESLNAIAKLFDRHHSAIAGVIGRSGGIRPAERKRCDNTLSLSEREEISRGIAAATSIRSIAYDLGRSPSTISREISRNGGRVKYRANQADAKAWERAKKAQSM